MPALRLAGSATCSVLMRGATSTPSVSGLTVSSGFFFAFMMFGSVTYRGSFRRRSVVSTAGSATDTVSRPPSTSRVTTARPSATSTFDAKVACGRSASAASICPVWLQSSSIACLPRITSPGCSLSTSAFRIFATASGCSSASVSTRMPRSAPIAIAVRSVSWHWLTPHDTATISVTMPFSFSRTASSTAISSKGFMLIFTLAMSTPVPSLFTRTFTL